MSLAAEKFKEDPNYRPYCLVCDTINRMQRTSFGFQCNCCKNTINEEMTHSDEPCEEPEQVFLISAYKHVEHGLAEALSAVAEEYKLMRNVREDPRWANQGRNKKGGRRRY